MKFNRILQRGRPSPIHSSGFVQRKSTLGSTNPESFADRQNREQDRQVVRSYKDAQIVRQYKQDSVGMRAATRKEMFMSDNDSYERPSEITSQDTNRQSAPRSSKIDIVKPTLSQPTSAPQAGRPIAPPAHSFREPPSRYRS